MIKTLQFMIQQLKSQDNLGNNLHIDHSFQSFSVFLIFGLGIVAYDSSVEVLLPLTRMDAGGKVQILENKVSFIHQTIHCIKKFTNSFLQLHAQLAVEKLTARGQTNLSGGLLQALNMLRTQQG
jgi:uncharacterized protein YegL